MALFAVGVLFCAATSTANAGFIVTSDPGGDVRGLLPAGGFGAGDADAPDEPLPSDNDPSPHDPALIAQFAAHGPSAPGGMSAPSVIGGPASAGSLAAVPAPRVPTPGDLSVRLARQRERYHPRFIKSRLFRPPRS